MATTATKIGRVSINPQGEYSSGTQYQRLDVVTYQGSGYICIQDCQNKPVTNTAYWYLLVSKGDTYEVTEEDLQRIALQIEEDASSLFNQLVAQKTSEFNSNATQKMNDFNSNATSKTSDFNSNATSKTSDFNTNATAKTTGFNQNATEKTTSFDANYNDKVGLFNGNATTKTTDFNTNATEKTSAFDEHVGEQTEDFDEHVESYSHRLDLLESNFEEKEATPSDNVTVTDSINGIVKKASLIGKTEQDTTSISGGDEYDSPSPAHPQPINNVTGDVIVETNNENFFDENVFLSATDWQLNDSGYYTGTSQDLKTYLDSNPIRKIFKGNTRYTLKSKGYASSANGSSRFIIHYTDNSTSAINVATYTTESTIIGVTDANKTISYITFTYSSTRTLYIKEVMLVEGEYTSESIPQYVPHKGKQVTFPLATGQKMYKGDYLADDGIHHVRKEVVLNGTENFTSHPLGENSYQLLLNDLAFDKDLIFAQSNCFKGIAQKNRVTSASNVIYSTDGVGAGNYAIVIRNTTFSTLNAFKTWLATQYQNGTPVEVEYKLAEEVIDPYTETQQIAWNKLQKLETYKNTTIVYTSSDDLSPDADFTYLVDPTVLINSRLDDLEQAVASLGANV